MHSYMPLKEDPSRAFEVARDPVDEPQPKPAVIDPPATCGIIVLACCDWKPKGPMSCPHSITAGMSFEVSRSFVLAYNSSLHAKQIGRWAVIMSNKTILILTNIPEDERPTDPRAFPKCVQTGFTKAQAEAVMLADNRERYRIAHTPRAWTIALVPMEGGVI